MKNIELTFNFNSVEEVKAFLDGEGSEIKGQLYATPKQADALVEPMLPEPTATTSAPVATLPAPVASVVPTAPATPITAPTSEVTTQVAVKNAMRDYKAAYGHPAYKALLAYFGAATVRDIPKAEYTAVVQMASVPPTGASPATIVDALPTAPAVGGVLDMVPAQPLAPTPVVSPEQLRAGLGEHKARWGVEATKAVLARVGYPDPNNIPADKYSEILSALEFDDPSAGGTDVDLSAF